MIIKFNLVPKEVVEATKEEKEPLGYFKVSALITGCVVLIIILMIGFLEFKSYELNKVLINQKVRLQKFKEIAREVKDMEKQVNKIRQKIEIMLSLRRSQRIQMERLYYILKAIGNEKIYFTQLKLNYDKAFISGQAEDIESIANYLKKLSSYKKIVSVVDLLSIEKNANLMKFSATVKFSNQGGLK